MEDVSQMRRSALVCSLRQAAIFKGLPEDDLQRADAPTGDVNGARWGRFHSMAMLDSGHGLVFTAALQVGKGGVTAATNEGVWAVDSAGSLDLLFRENDTIDGRNLLTFTVLSAAAGEQGGRASANSHGEVVWVGHFTGSVTRIMKTIVP